MGLYVEQTGTRNDNSAVDGTVVMSELSRGNFALTKSASNYMQEKYTISYINSIFNAQNQLEEFWNKCVSFASSYIKNFENAPYPETIAPDTSYLDGLQVGPNEQLGYITADGTNLFANPNGEVLAGLAIGTKLVATGRTKDGKWCQVRTSDGQIAYVPMSSIGSKKDIGKSTTASATDIQEKNGAYTGYVTADNTNLIANGKVVGTLSAGTAVTLTAITKNGKYYQVKTADGQEAYIPVESVSGTKSSGTTTPQSTTPRQTTPGAGQTTGEYNGMGYYLYEPDLDGTPKSLTIFFHGNGEDGGKLEEAASYGIGKQVASGKDFDGYVLVPHNTGSWDSKKINNLIDELSQKYNIDKNRISLAGYSNGANPVADLVRENPNKFSAVAFIGSYVDNDSTARALTNTPTRFLTGKGNSTATKHSESMVAKINDAGGNSASMDVYDGYGHSNPFVTMLYNDGGLYEWLTSQSRAQTT